MLILDRIPIFLISLLPLFLITGPFLSDLAISLSAIVYLYIFFFVEKKRINLKNYFIIFISIFYFYLLLSSILSDYTYNSLSASLFFFRFFIFSFCILYLYEKYENFKKLFLYILIFCFFIISLDSVVQYTLGYNLFGYEYDKYNMHERLSSFFGDEKILGNYILKIFPILLFLLINVKLLTNTHKVIFFYLISILSIVLIILSGERAALGSFSVLIFCFSFFIRWERKKRFFFLFIFACIIAFMFTKNIQFQERVKLTLDTTNGILAENGLRAFSPTHQSYIMSSIKMFNQNKIFGIGPKNFRILCSNDQYKITYLQRLQYSNLISKEEVDSGEVYSNYDEELLEETVSCSTHPHNTHVQLLAETGILGYLPFLLLILYLLKDLIINFKNLSDSYRIFLFTFLIFLFPLIPSTNFFNNYNAVFLFLNFGFFLISNKYKYIYKHENK